MNRIMIVDDALIMRMKIAELAQQAGWEVVAQAKNGIEAISLYTEMKPDLVTMDMVMPELDGLSALQEIRKLDPEARVVMVSAVNQKDKLRQCIALGAIDFIVKPFDPLEMKRFLEGKKTSSI